MKIIIIKKVNMKKIYFVICGKYRKFNDPKISYIFEKTVFAVSVAMKIKKYLKKKNQ